jgi:hypothetical protein
MPTVIPLLFAISDPFHIAVGAKLPASLLLGKSITTSEVRAMSGVFLLILAVVRQSDKPKAQNPNDLIYENKPLSVWLNQLSDKDPKVRKSAAYAMRDLGSKAKPQTGKDTPRLPRVLRVRPMNHIFPGMVTNRMRLRPSNPKSRLSHRGC